jgi:hypothetical protein
MNTFRSLFTRLCLTLILLTSLFSSVQATTYYVDPAKGDDKATGKDPATPWKTLWWTSKVAFKGGDKVLFIRGGVWSGQLDIRSAGSEGNPIYYGVYGDESQPKPTINGNGTTAFPIRIVNGANHVTVEGLAVTNFDGKDIFDGVEATRSGIMLGQWGGDLSDVKILHNEVYYVEGCSNHPLVGSPRGTTLDPKKYNEYTCAAIFGNAAHMKDILIDGNSIHDCTGTALMVAAFTNVSGLMIQNNTINNVGSDGIEILRAKSPVVQYNSCIHAANNSGTAPRGPGVVGYNGLASGGMWAFGSSDVLFQYNYCEGTKQIKYDGEAWDFDIGLSGTCIYQYNFSRDNEGGFILSQNDNKPGLIRICRFNISVNDGGFKDGRGEAFFNNRVEHYYNNIFYRTDGQPFFLPENKMSAPLLGAWDNNIFYTTSKADAPYQTKARTFTNNCFFGFTPKEPGTGAVMCDPLLNNIETAMTSHSIRNLEGFQLKPGSPCQGTGSVIPDNGGKDFWGKPVPADKMNIGAD